MAIALVSQNDATGTSAAPAVTLSVTSGNLLVLCLATRNGTGTHNSVADDQTQTWTQAGTPVQGGGAGHASVWYCQNAFTGSLTVTGTLSASDVWYVNLSQWSGQHATVPYLATDSQQNSSTTTHVHGGTGISLTAGQLLVACATQSSTVSDESYTGSFPFTALSFANSTNVRQWWGYRIAAGSESTVQGDWTQTSGSSGSRMAHFDQASGRTAKNTRPAPLGVEVGMGWRM